MFTNLAFIDWVALVFAAVLLAAAAASAVLAYATSRDRHGPAFRFPASFARPGAGTATMRPQRSPEHLTVSLSAPLRTSSVGAHAAVVDPEPGPSSTASTPSSSMSAVAARAAKLAGRPVPETPRKPAPEPERLHHGSSTVIKGERGQARLLADGDVVQGFKMRTPGFFEDPVGRHELRYWDGHRWTEYVKEHGERFTDPL